MLFGVAELYPTEVAVLVGFTVATGVAVPVHESVGVTVGVTTGKYVEEGKRTALLVAATTASAVQVEVGTTAVEVGRTELEAYV